MKIRVLAALAMAAFIAFSCSDTKSESETTEDNDNTAINLEGNDYLVTIKTDLGEMKAILYDETPQHKENFLKLVKEGFYDSLLFHRVINQFMIQGGDPNSKTATLDDRLGNGGPGYTVPAEILPKFYHVKGALSAARQPDQVNPEKASSGSQFYIVHGLVTPREQMEGIDQRKLFAAFRKLMSTQPDSELSKEYSAFLSDNPTDNAGMQALVESTIDRLTEATGMAVQMSAEMIEDYSTIGGYQYLDGEYTVFGRVIDGLDVIDKIAIVETRNPQSEDRPIEDVRMFITVEEMSKADIAAKYGNPYIQ